ncbi:MAG: purple acid phosphatase family protein [Promethearchaeota archaeon]
MENMTLQFKKVAKVIGRILFGLFFTTVLLLGILLPIVVGDDLGVAGGHHFFLGLDLSYRMITVIVVAVLVGFGGYGFYWFVKMIIHTVHRQPFSINWKPKVAMGMLVLFALAGVLYYNPFLIYDQNGAIAPKFGPYIGYYGENQMIVAWDGPYSESSALKYGVDPALTSSPLESESLLQQWAINPKNFHHAVILPNLLADTTYYYMIPELDSTIYSFHTPPTPESGNPVTFTIVGDTQGGLPGIKKIVQLMENDPQQPDFTCIAGDLVNRDDKISEWSMLFADNSYGGMTSSIPWMNAPGNHEHSCDSPDCGFREQYKLFFDYNYPGNYEQLPGTPDYGMYYSYNYSNVHMVSLDLFDNETYTRSLGKPTGSYLTTTQLEWLRDDLARNQDVWKFIYFHVPMYSLSDYPSNEDLCAQLEPIFDEYHVDAVFTGHNHNFEAFLVNGSAADGGIYHFTVGGGGAGIDTMMDVDDYGDRAWPSMAINVSAADYDGRYDGIYGVEYQLYGELSFHYMKVRVEGDTATFTAIRADDGSIIVQYTTTR